MEELSSSSLLRPADDSPDLSQPEPLQENDLSLNETRKKRAKQGAAEHTGSESPSRVSEKLKLYANVLCHLVENANHSNETLEPASDTSRPPCQSANIGTRAAASCIPSEGKHRCITPEPCGDLETSESASWNVR